MRCNRCGAMLNNGYCANCRINNVNNYNIQGNYANNNLNNNEIIHTKYLNEKNNIKTLIKLIVIGLIIFGAFTLIFEGYQYSLKSCVEENGSRDCGLGALCDHECMPPFYITYTMFYGFLTFFVAFIVIPLIVGLLLYHLIKLNSYKKLLNQQKINTSGQ